MKLFKEITADIVKASQVPNVTGSVAAAVLGCAAFGTQLGAC
jgi:hypothetical protein